MRRVLFTAALLAAAAIAPSARAASPSDYALIARDVVPSGAQGTPGAPNRDAEARLYDGLTPLFNNVTAADVNEFFKPETLGISNPVSSETPKPGVTISRDSFHVAHIFGATRDDVTWGSGWEEAEDRGLLLEQGRYDSRVAAIDAPGLSALNLISGLHQFAPSAQTEAEVAKQTNALQAYGAKGRAVLHDIDVYIAGINAYLTAHGSSSKPFTRNDIYALNALKGQFVGEGGGDEAVRSEFLSGLIRHLGVVRGWKVWHDLREANDPETPTSVPGVAHMLPPPKRTSGNVILDNNSLSSSAARDLTAERDARGQASNELIVSGKRSATHHPLMVAGPQIGYYYPGLTLEVDEEGPGISQRGVTAAPFPGYIFIGRSGDAGWSLTSAGLDIIDTYVETLCGNSRTHYLFRGHCLPMQFFNAGTLDPGTSTAKTVSFYRTVHGPVVGYARVHGRLVAVSRKRSSYGKDVLDQLFYHDLSHGDVHNIKQFFTAAAQTPQTFNSFYMDDKDIGVFTSGLVPIRPKNVDPALPMRGTGGEEWRGYYPAKDHPQGLNPASGQIVNWNNRTQAGYEAADDNWALGAVQRVSLLLRNLGNGRGITPQAMVSAMNAAATQDVREVTLEPLLSKVLRTGPAPSTRDAQMLNVLDAWYRHGASRLDRTDADGMGNITDPGAAIMDTAWPKLADAWASSVLGSSLSTELNTFNSLFDQPPSGQYHGWYIYMNKDLRSILGQRVRGAFSVRYCGGGSLRRCRAQLWSALNTAGNSLQAAQGSTPSAWRVSAVPERISFVPANLIGYTMRYANRPSGIQQVLSFGGHAPADTGR